MLYPLRIANSNVRRCSCTEALMENWPIAAMKASISQLSRCRVLESVLTSSEVVTIVQRESSNTRFSASSEDENVARPAEPSRAAACAVGSAGVWGRGGSGASSG